MREGWTAENLQPVKPRDARHYGRHQAGYTSSYVTGQPGPGLPGPSVFPFCWAWKATKRATALVTLHSDMSSALPSEIIPVRHKGQQNKKPEPQLPDLWKPAVQGPKESLSYDS